MIHIKWSKDRGKRVMLPYSVWEDNKCVFTTCEMLQLLNFQNFIYTFTVNWDNSSYFNIHSFYFSIKDFISTDFCFNKMRIWRWKISYYSQNLGFFFIDQVSMDRLGWGRTKPHPKKELVHPDKTSI